MNKYIYYAIIQVDYGQGWEDDDHHETDSTYWPKDRIALRNNIKAYRTDCRYPFRVIHRRELRQ